MGVLPEGSLVVKRTFLEFVTSPRAQTGRARFLTDTRDDVRYTQLLKSLSSAAAVECTPSMRSAVLPEASPACTPAWPATPMLDALCEPDLGPAWRPAPLDDGVSQQWLLPMAVWPGTLEQEMLAYQQPWAWMPLPDPAESCAMQGTCWSDPAAWPSSPAPSLASTAVGSDACSEADDPKEAHAGETRTTVMLRNVPTAVMRNTLLRVLDEMGFAGSVDMVYIPVDFSTGRGLGYAFVNMVSPSAVPALWQAFDGLVEWAGMASDKVCAVSWSEPNQGLAAHVERYRNSPVMHPAMPDEWKPALFTQGVRVEFPAPTKNIKAPKVRSKKAEAA